MLQEGKFSNYKGSQNYQISVPRGVKSTIICQSIKIEEEKETCHIKLF